MVKTNDCTPLLGSPKFKILLNVHKIKSMLSVQEVKEI